MDKCGNHPQKGNHMTVVRVLTTDPEKVDALKDFVRQEGIELLTSETESPSELVLFYLSRMNSKFDNLGQLKHLFKIERYLSALRITAEKKARMLDIEQKMFQTNWKINRQLYNTYIERSGHDPHLTNEDLAYLTMDDIAVIFGEKLSFN